MNRWNVATVAAIVLFLIGVMGFVGFAATMSDHKAAWEKAGTPVTYSQEMALHFADWFTEFWSPFLGIWLLVCLGLSFGTCALLPRSDSFLKEKVESR